MNMKSLGTLAGLIAVAGALFIWFGVYNIAATDKHWPVTTTLLELVRERSIEVRAEDLVVPQPPTTAQLKMAAQDYAEMCVQCHLAPGQSPTEIHQGLYPQPPVLHESDHASEEFKDNFWVIKNGIKLTGMPAWGASHTDEEIWALVAFIGKLPEMTADQYQQATDATSGGSMSERHHGQNAVQDVDSRQNFP